MTDKNDKLNLWVTETHKDIVSMGFRAEETLFSKISEYQQVDVIKTAGHGGMLLNDGIVMVSERDEFVYHEMIAHVPLFTLAGPERVLIIGGGDGGTAREVLRHMTVKRVVMVEIDAVVVEACKKHLPSMSGSLDDPRLELLIEDGVKFAEKCNETFDAVLIDSTDPIGPAQPLFDKEFYENISGLLSDNGIMISQSESPFYDPEIQRSMFSNQRPFFKKVHIYTFSTLTYPGGLWSFGFASKGPCPIKDFDPGRVKDSKLETRYYNPDVHRASFALPEFIKNDLAGLIDPVPF
ncbi:MAG: polyamine aminopropyltransferase [Desulfobacteraceae bacterium]|nr:polyamine aminopropyltransferase [Desulfobacteraceae bacterium]